MYGGTITISISNTPSSVPNTLPQYTNPHVHDLARNLEERCILEALRSRPGHIDASIKNFVPSDRAERIAITVRWESAPGALGIRIPSFFLESESEHIIVVSGPFFLLWNPPFLAA